MIVRAFPGLHLRQLAGPSRASRWLTEDAILSHLGRTAIVQALRAFGIGAGDDVLVPALHCGVEVEAVRFTEATPRFYPVPPSLLASADEIRARLTRATRAVLVTHVYGVTQDVGAVRAACEGHGVRVIEDCAHVFPFDAPSGPAGDAAIYSLPKFIPVPDGGVLTFRDGTWPAGARLPSFERPPGISVARRSARLLLDGWSTRHRATGAFVDRILLEPVRLLMKPRRNGEDAGGLRSSYNPASSTFDPSVAMAGASRITLRVLERTDMSQVAAVRRRNHELLGTRTANAPGFTPVKLPPGSVPMVFAVRARDRGRFEARLLERGIETFRFGAKLSPSLSQEERSGALETAEPLLGLPVHQDLDLDQMERVARAARECAA